VPPRSTFFFVGVPAFAAVQVGDGPLVRGVYRDTTLRSYFSSRFRREVLGRGPVFLFKWDDAARRLEDVTDQGDLWFNLGVGYLLNDHPEVAVEAFALERERNPRDGLLRYALAVALAARGDSAGAAPLFTGLGFALARDGGDLARGAERALAARDTATALQLAQVARTRALYDPRPHVVLSRIQANDPGTAAAATLEAVAAVTFAPGWAPAWRNWAALQYRLHHYPEALGSLERYFALDPPAAAADAEAQAWRAELQALMPGGAAAQRALREDLPER
jgi:tetratricopeptide (TPR) repeat protein